ncbi:DNA repair protein rhp57 [Dispira parvispora]|uniref:DNA repair protein rhp57 n=1 Tax=Dispira parvispora TaxID=1520584 RepID=A0A9W8AWQ1_9FUNG|nr:DNA repair protein rhp57 [Dispira parvispora]
MSIQGLCIAPTTAKALLDNSSRLTTGDPTLDKVLCGGIPTRGITELSGGSASGKTQLCLQLCLTVQLPRSLGGLAGSAIYFSTENAFPSRRLFDMIDAFRMRYAPYRSTLWDPATHPWGEKVLLSHLPDLETQEHLLLFQLPVLLAKQEVKLVVIDSITANYRSENLDAQPQAYYYADRLQGLFRLAQRLKSLSEIYGVAIVCINQVSDLMLDFDHPTTIPRPIPTPWIHPHHPVIQRLGKQPALGLGWSHCVNIRIMLWRGDPLLSTASTHASSDPPAAFQSPRILYIIFAPHLPSQAVEYIIAPTGLCGQSLQTLDRASPTMMLPIVSQ